MVVVVRSRWRLAVAHRLAAREKKQTLTPPEAPQYSEVMWRETKTGRVGRSECG